MLVIVSVSRLDNDRIEIGVARPQHDSESHPQLPFRKRGTSGAVRFWDQRRDNGFSFEIAGTNGRK